MLKNGGDKQKIGHEKKSRPEKIGPGKMEILKSCFDPLERRDVPDLVGVATRDEV